MQDWETLSHCLLCDSEGIEAVDVEYNICRCRACGYVFDNPRPTLGALVRFYSRPGKYDSWLKEEAGRDRLWKRRLKKMLKYGERGKLLDVGTGTGQFLRVAEPFFDSVAGTEVSQSGVQVAKERYRVEITEGELEECNLPRNSFDVVTLFHVLEHVPDPRRTVEVCRKLLKTGGLLVVCVPNDLLAWTSRIKIAGRKLGLRPFERFSSKVGVSRALSSSEIHLSHFTPKVLRATLEQAGFAAMDESLDPYYAASGLWLVLHTAYHALHRLLFALSRANRYDTIWLAARKFDRNMVSSS